jgi:hypothetical protein
VDASRESFSDRRLRNVHTLLLQAAWMNKNHDGRRSSSIFGGIYWMGTSVLGYPGWSSVLTIRPSFIHIEIMGRTEISFVA